MAVDEGEKRSADSIRMGHFVMGLIRVSRFTGRIHGCMA